MTDLALTTPVDEAAARRFLALPRIAVVGASSDKTNLGAAIARALHEHGTQVTTVHPTGLPVHPMSCVKEIAELAGQVDGALVVVPAPAAEAVVRACADAGIRSVWLFRGIGGRGSVSAEALQAATDAGIDVVAGACPLMFLEPVGWFHRAHRAVRRRRGALAS